MSSPVESASPSSVDTVVSAVSAFDSPLLSSLFNSGNYIPVLGGTKSDPPSYHHPFCMPRHLFIDQGIEACVWLNAKDGSEFIGVYRAGRKMSGHTPTTMHGGSTGLMMDEVLGAAATTTARVVSGRDDLAFMTRNLLTSYLRPVVVPNDLVVFARVSGVHKFKTEMDKVKDIEINANLFYLKDFTAWREAVARGDTAVKEPVILAKGRAEFAKVDLSAHLKRAAAKL